ncbi:leucine-rich repeat and transmembrane domain-containing protein 2-like protein [Lates japonicus]|uniref:Leucine-rich repeat and transmembrane domain-containing protein 2-like protein n=1 Tax=Lates japonicus TaxID=270547 RepID=A0AAD3NK23_LATJO|nr:leucine-rich repeat and transmembrane domain-containing protein 2-like protein [Lates japonicus]
MKTEYEDRGERAKRSDKCFIFCSVSGRCSGVAFRNCHPCGGCRHGGLTPHSPAPPTEEGCRTLCHAPPHAPPWGHWPAPTQRSHPLGQTR